MDLDRLQREFQSPTVSISATLSKMEQEVLDLQLEVRAKEEAMNALEQERVSLIEGSIASRLEKAQAMSKIANLTAQTEQLTEELHEAKVASANSTPSVSTTPQHPRPDASPAPLSPGSLSPAIQDALACSMHQQEGTAPLEAKVVQYANKNGDSEEWTLLGLNLSQLH